MGFGIFELSDRIPILAPVAAVIGQALLRPARQAGIRIVVGGEMGEVAGELSANDHFLQKRVLGRLERGCPGRLDRQIKRRNLPEVQIGTHAGNVVRLRLVVVFLIAREAALEELGKSPLRL